MMWKAAVIFGTRPEAIKLAPVILAFEKHPSIETITCNTGQHREMVSQVLQSFCINPAVQMNIMRSNQTLSQLSSRLLEAIDDFLLAKRPDLVIVQGDTTTAFCASLAAFYHAIPVVHVEAGLRTGNIQAPWPEEANRVMISRLASLHFAPTEGAALNLLNEGIPEESILLTGNTVVDALLFASEMVKQVIPPVPGIPEDLLDGRTPVVLITGHRRENFGPPFRRICQAILSLSARFPNCHFVYPVHLNPNVRAPVTEILGERGERPNIHLIEPLAYLPFVRLLKASALVLTDSGGIQEEAPSLGKPVLVMRDTTERPEAIASGAAELVGTDTSRIVQAVSSYLEDAERCRPKPWVRSPFGDGKAADRILTRCVEFLDRR
ncbi:UDP-N-acetylglucosamine 2-epimerase (non-hydrolyzing) [Mesorhizobium sp.]|uniref:non-hydrolyzing UDP-N-acetylglucosamine 2-epimerase n=1 Tax=Mesorhizobium sp. TaxID=1871066 RepID=UPI00257A77EE|nr:UDP-N-acetylglucosamine 2-epimerase (non-hydrolyzing) [Mesorhizobium sp.]